MQTDLNKAAANSKVIPCDTEIVTTRNRYFTGKYLTARDFEDEQAYFLSRHRQHNRLLHGWGIVEGLAVDPHSDRQCREEYVIVRKGVAIDSCGRELFLNCDQPVKLPAPKEMLPVQKGSTLDEAQQSAPQNPHEDSGLSTAVSSKEKAAKAYEPFLLCLVYCEEKIEQVPALYGDEYCDPTHMEYNRISASVDFVCVPLSEVDDDCWHLPTKYAGSAKTKRGDMPQVTSKGSTDRSCRSKVPLALITYREFPPGTFPQQGSPETIPCIDMHGRRLLHTGPESLTHIISMNWEHGKKTSISKLQSTNDQGNTTYQLEVEFDDRLLICSKDEAMERTGDEEGINPFTFTVHYQMRSGGSLTTPKYLVPHEVKRDEATGCKASLVINECDVDDLIGCWVYVTLKCDFIPDIHGNPVDGNFLRGNCPTGNGTPGGTFESWFFVCKPEDDDATSRYEPENTIQSAGGSK